MIRHEKSDSETLTKTSVVIDGWKCEKCGVIVFDNPFNVFQELETK